MHGDGATALERSRCGATSLRGGAASQPPGPWGSFRAASAPGPIWADLPLTPATGSRSQSGPSPRGRGRHRQPAPGPRLPGPARQDPAPARLAGQPLRHRPALARQRSAALPISKPCGSGAAGSSSAPARRPARRSPVMLSGPCPQSSARSGRTRRIIKRLPGLMRHSRTQAGAESPPSHLRRMTPSRPRSTRWSQNRHGLEPWPGRFPPCRWGSVRASQFPAFGLGACLTASASRWRPRRPGLARG